MHTSQQIRDLWNKFWEQQAHTLLPPASLIADKSSTALFNVAGMQPLIPYLSGQEHPLGTKLYNIQACIRTNDLDEVGDDSHHTMFFMMGNWSLGDYFKKDAVRRSWKFLTQELQLDPRKLAVTVYEWDQEVPADDETAQLWQEQGVPTHKISYLSADDNWWSPGPVGPCGPCTEIYYWIGEGEYPSESDNVAKDDSQWLEIWNNVFMEFYRNEQGTLTKLSKQNVDTGMWFERICKVLQKTKSPYETDLFQPLIKTIEQATNKNYHDYIKHMRVIADHIRSSSFLIAEWLQPSNEGRGYVLRRLIRRLYFHLYEIIGEQAQFETIMKSCEDIITTLVLQYQKRIPILTGKQDHIITIIRQELQQFAKTLNQGQKILNKYISELSWWNILPGDQVFMLYDTFGFPVELTEEIANKQHVTIDYDGFTIAMERARDKSRSNTLQGQSNKIDWSIHTTGLPPTQFIWYSHFQSESNLLKKIDFDGYTVLIFDKTPFYATMGGQIHDKGIISDADQHYEVFDVQAYNGVFLHFVRPMTKGSIT